VSRCDDGSMGVIDVLGVYELPAPIVVDQSVLGHEFPIRVMDLRGYVVMPTLVWEGDTPSVRNPEPPGLPSWLRSVEGEAEPRWGRVESWNVGSRKINGATVNRVALHFTGVSGEAITYGTNTARRGHPQGEPVDSLLAAVPEWFGAVRTWVAALALQDTEADAPLASVSAPGLDLLVWTMDGGVSSTVTQDHTTHVLLRVAPTISHPMMRLIFQLANEARPVPDEHRLLISARAALRREQYRRAVLDAGTATELALTRVVDDALAPLPERLRDALTSQQRTLGPLVNLASKVVQLPVDINKGLVTPRNRAMHANETPARDIAFRAEQIAREVVALVEPLPSPDRGT
jgi:hypothetical protein